MLSKKSLAITLLRKDCKTKITQVVMVELVSKHTLFFLRLLQHVVSLDFQSLLLSVSSAVALMYNIPSASIFICYFIVLALFHSI